MIWEAFAGLVYSAFGLIVGYYMGKLRRDVTDIQVLIAKLERIQTLEHDQSRSGRSQQNERLDVLENQTLRPDQSQKQE